MIEPKFDSDPKKIHFPSEPGFNEGDAQELAKPRRAVPRIVPADLRKPLTPEELKQIEAAYSKPKEEAPAEEKKPEAKPAAAVSLKLPEKPAGAANKDPQALMSQLSADLNELSKPAEAQPQEAAPAESAGETQAEAAEPAAEESEDEVDDNQKGSGFTRTLLSFICIIFIAIATWQVTLFLQPEILREEPFNEMAEASCEFLYCPPVRTPIILDSQINATGDNSWVLTIQVQNQDMRPQKLPTLQLFLTNAQKQKTELIFEPKDYKAPDKVRELEGGQTIKIDAPFIYEGARPTKFTIRIAEPKK